VSAEEDDEGARGADDAGDGHRAPRWAADEPTAMWDDSVLEDAGYDRLASHREEKPREATGPATRREVGGDLAQGIHVSKATSPGTAPVPSRKNPAIGWILTAVVAVLLGGGVYALIRFLR
jgi:hypothetical protein